MKIPLDLFLYLIKDFLESLKIDNDISTHLNMGEDEIVT
jgi:hypothetical protein